MIKKSSTQFITMLVIATLAVWGISEISSAQKSKKRSKKRGTVAEVLKSIESEAEKIRLRKANQALPKAKKMKARAVRNLRAVKPPRSSKLYYDEGTDEAKLEGVTDEGIDQLYKLTKRFRKSKKRGELWLRLAELYVEKARLIEFRLQNEYDDKLSAYQSGKTRRRPKLDLRASQNYNRKAIELYEWFLRDFPKDPKVDQALFFLGYNYFEVGDVKKGRGFYERLTKERPRSPYVAESHFALGEFFFENEKWKEALPHYTQVAKNKRARLFAFALYKMAWCRYKMSDLKRALKTMERVIFAGRKSKGAGDKSIGGVSKIRLASEATRDIIVFFAEAGHYKNAKSYFRKIIGNRNLAKNLEKLAYYYADQGNRVGARYIFADLINEKPLAPKAYDFQYQIVTMYVSAGDNKTFRKELFKWIENYGPESVWFKANQKNRQLVVKATQLIETTLRNFVLQLHQTARNSRAPYSQKLAQNGYELYFTSFKKSPRLAEMHFFYAELLFEMRDYKNASRHYLWVVDNGQKTKYFKQALLNALLSFEKDLPSPNEIRKLVGDTSEPVEFDGGIRAFVKIARRYVQELPKAKNVVAIKYRVGSLHYYYNQFDKALEIFNDIVKNHSKTRFATFSANLILDIYNIKKDYTGLEKAAEGILAIPSIAKSALGNQIRKIKAKTAFKRAQELEKGKFFDDSAKAYEEFAAKNSGNSLSVMARFNSAVNYERTNNLGKAIANYQIVLAARGKGSEALRKKSRRFLALLYEKSGQYAKAASMFEKYSLEFPKDPASIDFIYNAAVIRDGMQFYTLAIKNYQKYYDGTRKPDRFETIFLIGKIWERRRNYPRAIGQYEKYIKSGSTNEGGIVEAAYLIAKLNERLKRKKRAEEWYKKVIATQRIFAEKGNSTGVKYAAEARLKLILPKYYEFRNIRIPRNPKGQQRAVQQKLNRLNRLKEQLKKVIAYDDGYQIVAALTLLGQSLQHMAAAIYKAPLPKGLKPLEIKDYKAGIEKLAKPFQDEAIETYRSAVERGFQLQGYNDWLKVAMKELNKLDEKQYPDYGQTVLTAAVMDKMDL